MNSSKRIVAQRYASAYDALSKTNEEASQRSALLNEVSAALLTQQQTMESPRLSLQSKKQAVRAALSGAPETARFIELLIDAKRYDLLPEIARRVEDLLDQRLGIIRAQVFAAKQLSEAQKKQTQDVLAKRYGGSVKAEFITDPRLLGGLKIRCCGEEIDGSLQHQLNKLQEELTK